MRAEISVKKRNEKLQNCCHHRYFNLCKLWFIGFMYFLMYYHLLLSYSLFESAKEIELTKNYNATKDNIPWSIFPL